MVCPINRPNYVHLILKLQNTLLGKKGNTEKFCELKKGNTNLKILFEAGITYHESLICCEESPEYKGEQVTVPIAPLLDFEGN